MRIQPLSDRVVVTIVKQDEVTASGIVLPDTVDKEKKTEGEIVAVGPGKVLENGSRGAMDVSVGQKVLFKSWGGDDVTVDGVDYKILSADDILAILN